MRVQLDYGHVLDFDLVDGGKVMVRVDGDDLSTCDATALTGLANYVRRTLLPTYKVRYDDGYEEHDVETGLKAKDAIALYNERTGREITEVSEGERDRFWDYYIEIE